MICKRLLAIALLLTATPAFADGVVAIQQGQPKCNVLNPTPNYVRGVLFARLTGDQYTITDPFARWPKWAGHSYYSALSGLPTVPSVALYRFAKPQIVVAFVLGTPDSFNQFTFWSNGEAIEVVTGDAIVTALGPAPSGDYNLRLSLSGGRTFDAFSFTTFGNFLEFGNFEAPCQ